MAEFRPAAGIEKGLMEAPAMAAMLLGVTEEAKGVAESIAPVGRDDDPHPGQFRDSFEARVGLNEVGVVVGRLLTTDPEGNLIEFGTEDTPPHAVLRRSVEAVGLTIRGGRE